MKKRVVICGGGPHSEVVIDILLDQEEYDLAGVVDRDGNAPFGLPLLGTDDDLPRLRDAGITHAFVAVGSNRVRRLVTEKLESLGFQLVNVIASDAVVSRRSSLGKGVLVNHGAIVNAGTRIGDGVILNTGCTVDHDCTVGSFAHIAPGVHISGSTHIGDLTMLGVGSCVKDGIVIGSNTTIGAGAAVISDIPADCTAVGVPARIIKFNT